jgi:hypothetical protein
LKGRNELPRRKAKENLRESFPFNSIRIGSAKKSEIGTFELPKKNAACSTLWAENCEICIGWKKQKIEILDHFPLFDDFDELFSVACIDFPTSK